MPAKSKNPLRSIEMRVSQRDRQIYQAVVIEQRLQSAVATEHGIKQPRVSAIVRRVRKWRALPAPPGMEQFSREEQLRVAARDHRDRLVFWHQQAVVAWQSSKQTKHKVKVRKVKGEEVEERTVEVRDGDDRLFKVGLLAADKIVQFEGFDLRGNVDVSNNGRVPEPPKMVDEELYRGVKRKVMSGDFDTLGDEGVPGMWQQEAEKRNAEVIAAAAVAEETLAEEIPANAPLLACVTAVVEQKSSNQKPTVVEDEKLKSSSAECNKVLCKNERKTSQDNQQPAVTSKIKTDHLLYNAPPAEGARQRPPTPVSALVRGYCVPVQHVPDDEPPGTGEFRWANRPRGS
ncbi:hypothetical protein [Anatilimnocola floriformis]|uniref:hypothetical protein n=1 Tax=Anatilimnocola floriformis TaxID=2948575 RepID=UPI0020C58E84|nr:hypothetical protein [Anatilimnocola floriformis]